MVGQRAAASGPSAIWPRPFVSIWMASFAYFDTKLTSGAIEAVNGIIQLAKRIARGFRNFVYFRTAGYHRAGQLNLDVPNMS
jgi:transposase